MPESESGAGDLVGRAPVRAGDEALVAQSIRAPRQGRAGVEMVAYAQRDDQKSEHASNIGQGVASLSRRIGSQVMLVWVNLLHVPGKWGLHN